MRYLSWILLVLTVASCTNGDGDADGIPNSTTEVKPQAAPSNVTMSMQMNSDIDEAAQTITTYQENKYCMNGVLKIEEETSTLKYKASGGRMLVWEDGKDCKATELSGSSSTIYGTWTFTGPTALPSEASAGTDCEEYDGPPEGSKVVVSKNGSITISSSQDFCATDEIVAVLPFPAEADGCDKMQVTMPNMPNGDTMLVTLNKINIETGAINMSFTYNGKECVLDDPGSATGSDLTEADCEMTKDDDGMKEDSWTEVMECIMDAAVENGGEGASVSS